MSRRRPKPRRPQRRKGGTRAGKAKAQGKRKPRLEALWETLSRATRGKE